MVQYCPTKKYTQKERVTHFIHALKLADKRFDTYREAHEHLEQFLKQTEVLHEAKGDQMFFPSMSSFAYYPQYGLYLGSTYKQCVLLHEDGAYGICQDIDIKENNFKPVSYYRMSTDYLIRVVNHSGKDLFDTSA